VQGIPIIPFFCISPTIFIPSSLAISNEKKRKPGGLRSKNLPCKFFPNIYYDCRFFIYNKTQARRLAFKEFALQILS